MVSRIKNYVVLTVSALFAVLLFIELSNNFFGEDERTNFSEVPKYDQPQFFAEFDFERFKNPNTNLIPVESKLKAYQFARKNALSTQKKWVKWYNLGRKRPE